MTNINLSSTLELLRTLNNREEIEVVVDLSVSWHKVSNTKLRLRYVS